MHEGEERIYLRPAGLIPASGDRLPDPEAGFPAVLPLCGDGLFDFTSLEVITRRGTRLTRRLRSLGDIWDADASPGHQSAAATLERIVGTRRRLAGLSLDRPQIMGVVNVTPDSFSDGGQLASAEEAIDHALRLEEAGATLLDIGGESTRPGSQGTPLDEELRRVLPVIAALAQRSAALISIDTRKAEVMRQAVDAGAHIINDITALTHDPDSMAVAAESGLPVVLMHALGDPRTMQDDPRYDDVATDIYDYLAQRIAACEAAGIPRHRLIVDPGIGFGKTFEHNLQLLSQLTLLHGLGCPVLLGASRKRFIGLLTDEPVAAKRMAGSVGAALAGAAQGVQILRVHDVRETKAALAVFEAALLGRARTQP